MAHLPRAADVEGRRKVTVEEYVRYHREGYVVVPGLLSFEDVAELLGLCDDILWGREPLPGLEPVRADASEEELYSRFTRIHMLHRASARAERGLLHPRVLDVLEALIGPDVLALQSMLFLNPPGRGGQGWHQDSYYITTFPDTLIGVWIALDPADEENGCLWVAPGTSHEPIYPPHNAPAHVHAAGAFQDLREIEHASHLDESVNTLSPVARKHGEPFPIPLQPGDALFFHGHLLHRSHPNRSKSRMRRSFVCHYCNGRSWVPWNHGAPFEGDAANGHHLLGRGWSHLPFASPKFGTSVWLSPPEGAGLPDRLMGGRDNLMEPESGIALIGELQA
ncbi:MAG: phytanoyl-CoA dioxygenase family protein [Fimbriimonadales bacterium]|nr:phytanoyl-CoA dioxygenase family protein [Fimbriimonadales bacterium]